jgi:hypothetical protein
MTNPPLVLPQRFHPAAIKQNPGFVEAIFAGST